MNQLSVVAAAAEAGARLGLIACEPSGDSRVYTYAELAEEAARRAVNGAPGRLVPVVAERDPATAMTVYAALERRTPLLLLHPRQSDDERERARELARRAGPLVPAPALALLTSGSSAAPKAVLLGRDAIAASAEASAARLGWRPADGDGPGARWLCCLPLAHIGGLSILTRCLIARRP
ncbi:MAG: hypothetical protein AAGC55_07710, partial [Myxococcota bacterium]